MLRRYALPAWLWVRPPMPDLTPDRLYAYLDALFQAEGLRRVAARLSPGGVVLVDDCDPGNDYPGAMRCYRRFVREQNRPMSMGVVRGSSV